MKARLLKVGTAIDFPQREANLRGQRYSGVEDWLILFSAKVSAGGRIEGEALARLSRHHVTRGYTKDGREQIGKELLSASLSQVMTVLGRLLETEGAIEVWHHSRWREYEFR